MPESAVQHLFDQLIQLGEDREELEFYRSLFDDLSPQAQQEMRKNLEQEIATLASVS
jgi:hypothetical protein